MQYLHYAFLVICSLLADLLNFFLAPIVVLFASKSGWLPRYMSWFQTPDNSLDGDNGWKEEHRPYKVEDSAFKQWWNRTRWLHRNSMYGFAISVLGAKLLSTDIVSVTGNYLVSNRPLLEGLVIRKVIRNNKVIYFQYYYVKAWSDKYCIRINLGWKLWGNQPSGQLVFSPSFTMGYTR